MVPAVERKLSVDQAAYVAGAIDGEGSIRLAKHRRVDSGGVRFHFRVTIANTNHAWLVTLQSWIGGQIVKQGQPEGARNRRQCYQLELRSAETREVLRQIQPYLLIKRKHADLLFRYFELAAVRRAMNLPGQPADPEITARIEAICDELKSLNLRGLKPVPPPPLQRSSRRCLLDGCVRPHYSNGYCKQHHKKYIERGGPTWYEKPCIRCGRVFVAKRGDAVFCSKACTAAEYGPHRKRKSPSPD
jgi:hypothetical protein